MVAAVTGDSAEVLATIVGNSSDVGTLDTRVKLALKEYVCTS